MYNWKATDNDIEFHYNETYDMLCKTNPKLYQEIENKIEKLYEEYKGENDTPHALFDAECDVLHGQGYSLTDNCEWVKKIWGNFYYKNRTLT
tara:strand:+ start:31 stop:306 length:276 start_codon:yes stop_codon:yes gene_type:complete